MKQAIDNKTIDMWEKKHTASGLEINTSTALDNNPVHEAIGFYWGERCPEHEDGCPVCEAWKQYDNMTGVKTK